MFDALIMLYDTAKSPIRTSDSSLNQWYQKLYETLDFRPIFGYTLYHN